MAPSILAAALMFWSSGPMPWFMEAVFFFMFGMTSFIGLLTFFFGFRLLRFSKIVADTPRVPIRSVALGLVNIRGKTLMDQPVLSPVSHTPCCFYKVDLEEWVVQVDRDGRKTADWGRMDSDRSHTRFFLVDDSGRTVIDLSDVSDGGLVLQECSQRIVDSSVPHPSVAGVTDEEILSYIGQATKQQASSGRYRLHEFLILPGQDYQIVGTCAENPDAKGMYDHSLVCRGKKSLPFLISPESVVAQYELPDILRSRARFNLVVGSIVSVIGLGLLLLFIAWLLNGQVPLNAQAHARACVGQERQI